jgi:uncharacterized iron-regulated protein
MSTARAAPYNQPRNIFGADHSMRISLITLSAILALAGVLAGARPASAAEDQGCPVCAHVKDLMIDLDQELSVAARIPRRIYDLRGGRPRMISYGALIRELASQDAVFVGEYHDDPSTHKLELDLLTQLDTARPGQVVVGMEMFERDVQSALDEYTAGRSKEEDFTWASRPWGNYPSDYRPIIEYCRSHQIQVRASNTPTELVRRISRQGFEAAMQSYTPAERGFLAATTSSPKDQYWENFSAVMGMGAAHGDDQGMSEAKVYGFYQAQCMKDDTMGESMALIRDAQPSKLVLHYSGSFHVDFKLGTAARYMARRPADKTVVLVLRPVETWSSLDPLAEPGVADFIIFVPGPKWGKPHDAAMQAPKETVVPDAAEATSAS